MFEDFLQRFFHDIDGRFGGPMTFRFYFQPLTAIFLGIKDGVKDANTGQPAYFFTLFSDTPENRRRRLREGMKSLSRVLILILVMDIAYEFFVLKRFYPGESLFIALVVGVIPYMLARGLANRIYKALVIRGQARPGNVR